MKITNNAPGVRIINVKDGDKVKQVALASGETQDLNVVETAGHKARVESGIFTVGKAPAKADATPTGPQAVHRGGGSYSVMEGDKEAVEKLTKADADAFNSMSDDDKAKFVAERAKP